MLDQLPPELLLSIATDEELLRCDQISLSKVSRALRARLLHLVFSEIGIDSIDPAKLPTRVNLLEGKEHLVKSFKFTRITYFYKPTQLFIQSFQSLRHINFTFRPTKLQTNNHFLLVFTTTLQIPTLKSIRAQIERQHWTGHGIDMEEGKSEFELKQYTRGVLSSAQLAKEKSALEAARATGSTCKLETLHLDYRSGARLSPFPIKTFWDELFEIFIILAPYVEDELEELKFLGYFEAGLNTHQGMVDFWGWKGRLPVWNLKKLKRLRWVPTGMIDQLDMWEMLKYDPKAMEKEYVGYGVAFDFDTIADWGWDARLGPGGIPGVSDADFDI